MNRVYLGVYIIGTLLVWEAMHNYGKEMKRRLAYERRQLVASTKRMAEYFHDFTDMVIHAGITMEQAARQFEAYGQLMASWYEDQFFSIRDQFAEFPVHLNLCWRCEGYLQEDEMEFGLCENCRQELEDL
jgi:hypothetical protein